MLKIRHIALASDHPGKAAEFYKSAFGFREIRRFGLDPNKPDEAPRPSGVFLTDGVLNIAILKFANDQLGKGIDFVGIHHFGVVVDDVEEWTRKLEAMGAPCLHEAMPPGAHAEYKFRGPDGVVFDITKDEWEGSQAVSPEDRVAELPQAAE
jgi:catechol 2,3-dioxygenase-like lactoylglutathione lyase family enzyme